MNEFQYQTKLAELIEPLSPEETSQFNTQYGNSKKDPIIALVISQPGASGMRRLTRWLNKSFGFVREHGVDSFI